MKYDSTDYVFMFYHKDVTILDKVSKRKCTIISLSLCQCLMKSFRLCHVFVVHFSVSNDHLNCMIIKHDSILVFL